MEALIATKEQGSRVYSFKNEGGYLIGSCSIDRVIADLDHISYRITDIDICVPQNADEKLEAMIQSIIKLIAIDTRGQPFSLQLNNEKVETIYPEGKSMPFSKQYTQGES